MTVERIQCCQRRHLASRVWGGVAVHGQRSGGNAGLARVAGCDRIV